MRELNTHVKVTNKQIKEQFDDIDRENLAERMNYGIVSDTMPNKEDSPFGLSILVQRVSISVVEKDNYIHNTDCIVFSYLDENGNGKTARLEEKQNPNSLEWTYCERATDTLVSLANAINKVCPMTVTAYVINDGSSLLIYGVTSDNGFSVSPDSNNAIAFMQSISIAMNAGTVVFPNKNVLSFEESTLEFPVSLLSTNDMVMLCLKYAVIDGETSINEFGEEVVKNTSVVGNIEFEDASSDLDENTVCIGIIKVYNGSIHLVDIEGHTYPYNRPWFSSKDVKHRNQLGTSSVTAHNPHGIDYDDIDSDNTLHNRLLNDGLILSKPSHLQDIPGLFIVEHISGSSIQADIEGMLSKYSNRDAPRFYCLKYKPTHIHKILADENNQTKEIYLKWIEDTPYLLCDSYSGDIVVIYSYSKTAQPVIQKTQGVLLNPLSNNDVMFSEGKNVRLFNSTVDIFHRTNINRYFFVNIDKDGNIETNPRVLVSNTLDVESGNSSDVRERSRLAVFLYNTKCKSQLEAPNTGVHYKSNKELNLFKTNISYSIQNGSLVPYLDSYTSPAFNSYEEVEENEWLEIDMSSDYSGDDLVTKNLHCYTTVIDKDNLGRYSTSFSMPINIKRGTVTHVKGYIVVTGSSSDVSVLLSSGSSVLFSKTSGETNVTYIKIDEDIPSSSRVDSSSYILNIQTSGNFYVQNIHLELDYDEVRVRYFITQDEDGTDVTRLLYDSTKSYLIYGEPFVEVVGKLLRIKKSAILYDYLDEGSSISDYYFPKMTIETNSDFNVDITIYGEANGESVSESVMFDDTFREQYGLNYKILSNAFTSVSKYTINNTTTEGSVLVLAYPLSNYLNPARIMYANYESDRLKDFRDIRLCVPTIQNSRDFSREFLAKSCDINL